MKSPFLKWFVAQFGKSPNAKPSNEVWNEYWDLKYQSERKFQHYRAQVEWEVQKDAALKAWEARKNVTGR